MERQIHSKTGPAQRYINGRLTNGFIELTSDYLGFRPISNQDDIGFLQWYELKSIKFLKANMLRPAIIQVSRIGSNAPLLLSVSDPDAWIKLIIDTYQSTRTAKPIQSKLAAITYQSTG